MESGGDVRKRGATARKSPLWPFYTEYALVCQLGSVWTSQIKSNKSFPRMFPGSHYVASQSRVPFVHEHFVRKVRRWRLRKRLSDGRVYLEQEVKAITCLCCEKFTTRKLLLAGDRKINTVGRLLIEYFLN